MLCHYPFLFRTYPLQLVYCCSDTAAVWNLWQVTVSDLCRWVLIILSEVECPTFFIALFLHLFLILWLYFSSSSSSNKVYYKRLYNISWNRLLCVHLSCTSSSVFYKVQSCTKLKTAGRAMANLYAKHIPLEKLPILGQQPNHRTYINT